MNKGTRMLKEIIEREGTNKRGNHVMNFSEKEHWDCLCEMFGGEEHLKSEYPLFYEKMLKTARMQRNGFVWAEDEDVGPVDGVWIRDTLSDDKTTGASGLTCLTAPATQFFHSMTLIQNDEEIGRNVGFARDRQVSVLGASIDSGVLLSKTDLITSLYHSVWDDQETGMLRAETSVQYHIVPLSDPVVNVEVIHPCYYYGNSMSDMQVVPNVPFSKSPVSVPKVDPSPSGRTTINTTFKRQIAAGEVIDYDYPDTTKSNGKEMYQDIQLKAYLADGYEFDTCTYAQIVLEITGGSNLTGDGSIFHKGDLTNAYNVYSFTDESNSTHGFYFLAPTDWQRVIQENSMAGDKTYRIEVFLKFTCKGSSDEYVVSVSCESGVTDDEGHQGKTQKLRLLYGCLKKGTLVAKKNADGVKMEAIENIQIGDKILDENHQPVEVTNKIDGADDCTMYIETEDGHKIEVSMDHPMMTNQGGMPASHILPSYKMKMENGDFQKIKYIYRVEKKSEVYGIELEGGHWFIANGFVTGDNQAQGACLTSISTTKWRTASPEEIAEIEKMNAEFGME